MERLSVCARAAHGGPNSVGNVPKENSQVSVVQTGARGLLPHGIYQKDLRTGFCPAVVVIMVNEEALRSHNGCLWLEAELVSFLESTPLSDLGNGGGGGRGPSDPLSEQGRPDRARP